MVWLIRIKSFKIHDSLVSFWCSRVFCSIMVKCLKLLAQKSFNDEVLCWDFELGRKGENGVFRLWRPPTFIRWVIILYLRDKIYCLAILIKTTRNNCSICEWILNMKWKKMGKNNFVINIMNFLKGNLILTCNHCLVNKWFYSLEFLKLQKKCSIKFR